MYFDVLEPKLSSKKLILIIPGVTGCSADLNIQEFAQLSVERDYVVVILNHFVPKYDSNISGVRLLDFSDANTMHEMFKFVSSNF